MDSEGDLMSEYRSLPLTDLSEDEQEFRAAVRAFAEEKIRPQVRQMDEQSCIPRALIDTCFELGLMGIEIPEAQGGSCLLYTSPSPRDRQKSRMPSSA